MCFRYAFFAFLPADGKQRCPAVPLSKHETRRKRDFYYGNFDFSPSVSQGKRSGSRKRLCSRSAEQLRRRFFCGQHRRFRLRLRRYHQVHHPVLQPARYPELSDHRHRSGNGGGRKLRGYPRRVRQQGRHARRSGDQLGLGCQHPDLDLPSAGGELGGQQRRGRSPCHRTGLRRRAEVRPDPGLRFLQRRSGHRLCRRCRGLLQLLRLPEQRQHRRGGRRRHHLHCRRQRRGHRDLFRRHCRDLLPRGLRHRRHQGRGRPHPDLHPDLRLPRLPESAVLPAL